ncbi:MAG TPA: TonB family protein [Opitutaceae bacterium]|nr:TonB family protein [Opitutaceae bacterium]
MLRYADQHSEQAFKQFVEQNVGIVYSAALRRTNGNVHFAEDVTQAVFSSVAHNPRMVARHPFPTGWLYVATRNAASNLIRSEKRRKEREFNAAMQLDLPEDGPADDLERLSHQVTTAIDALNENDREAILLRYFKGLPFSEIGIATKTSEDTARKRVERALERIRHFLGQRGITSTLSALAAALDGQAATFVPLGLAARISGESLSSLGSRSHFSNPAKMTKIRVAAAIGATALGLFFVWQKGRSQNQPPPVAPQRVRVTAPSAPPPANSEPAVAHTGANIEDSHPLGGLATDNVQMQIVASTTRNMRSGARGVTVNFIPIGMLSSRIQAGRVTIKHALDDKGTLLTQETTNKFYSISVGRIDNSKDLTSREPTSFSLWGLSADSKELDSILGVLELVVPDLDADSIVTVPSIATKFGSSISSEALTAAGVRVTAFDKHSAYDEASNKVPGGPQDYDSGPFFGPLPKLPPGFPVAKTEMEDGDVAVAIDDPNDHLISIEFQAADGTPLNYDHAGHYHSSGIPGSPGKRFDVYHVGSAILQNARMVCWLLTQRALLRIPIQIAKLPIPAEGGPFTLGMVTVQVPSARSATQNAMDYDKAHPASNVSQTSDGTNDRIAQLWSDVPEYVAVIKGDLKYKKLPKLISSVAPAPPPGTIFPAHGYVKVTVSFVVAPSGNVEAARVLDSNNSDFNIPAVSSVLQWKFTPGETEKGPALTMIVVPFVFNPTDSAPQSATPSSN